MESLAAFSLAANICQFVDFGCRIVHEAKQISKSGTSLNVQHLSLVTVDLKKLLLSLNQQLEIYNDPNVCLNSEDQALLDLANGCNEVAQALLDGLQKYPMAAKEEEGRRAEEERRNKGNQKTDEGEQGRRGLGLRSIRAALGLVWGSKRLGELQDRLNNYRAEISVRLLVSLNANQRVQSHMLSQLKEESQEIVEVISLQCNTLRLKLDQDRQRYTEIANTDRKGAERRHAETIAAILTNRDGRSTTITSSDLSDGNLFQDSVHTGQSFATRTFRGQQTGGSFISGDYTVTSSIDLTQFATHILGALEFREMGERQAKVAKTYRHTFEWIYDDPQESQKPWDNFAMWLRSGDGIYWINGKAGSGKSTLMKHISAHESTLALLKQWAGDEQLFVGTFFFWYAGTSLQKSQAGLLRCLLLGILRNQRELVPVLFPNVIRALQSGQEALPLELTETELQNAFSSLVQTDLLSAKVCFIVDGLDEYDGDHDELANLFTEVTSSQNVKIVLSSRPVPAYFHAFSECRSLRLQDLTVEDIRYFVDNELSQHNLMRRLEAAVPGATDELVQTIASKASGVFLWVAVVVKMLIRGLRDGDTVADLRRKLIDLPEELEQLYSHMLRSMSKAHRTQGSKLLQLVYKSSKTQGHFPMTLLQLSFAEEEDYEKGLGEEPYGMSEEDESWRTENTEGRLRSRCCGLAEVQEISIEREETFIYVVGFLHRTVIEFLEDGSSWNEITSWTSGTRFDATKALLYSSMAELRAKVLPREAQVESTAFRAMARLLTFEMTMDREGQELCREKFVPEATRILFSTWGENEGGRCNRLGLSPREKLLATAAHHCSERQLQPLLDLCDGSASPPLIELVSRAQVAAFLLSEYVDEVSVYARLSIARGIVACHGDPNEAISFRSAGEFWNHRYKLGVHDPPTFSWTLWEFLLHHLQEQMTSDLVRLLDKGLLDTIFDILIALLEDGAKCHTSIALMGKRDNLQTHGLISHDASQLIESFCCRIWDPKSHKTLSPGSVCSGTLDFSMSLTILAEKLTRIQALFTSETQIQRECQPDADVTGRPRHEAIEMKGLGRKPKRGVGKKIATESTEFFLDKTKPPRMWNKSPWQEHVPSNESPSSLTKQSRPAMSAAAQEIQAKKRWATTSRADRLSLLPDADREIAIQMSRVNLSARDQRKLLLEMTKRTSNQQEKLFQCVEALRMAGSGREAH